MCIHVDQLLHRPLLRMQEVTGSISANSKLLIDTHDVIQMYMYMYTAVQTTCIVYTSYYMYKISSLNIFVL